MPTATEGLTGMPAEAEIADIRRGYEALDRNWEAVHEGAMRPIREAIGNQDATVFEIVEAIEALKNGSSWQPIETAPKGASVLLFFPKVGSNRMPLSAMQKVGRVIDYPSRPPTHWMPLPEPPTE